MKKKSLCIGNALYPTAKLRNPVNDATELSSQLELLGFKCQLLSDSSFHEMYDGLKLFAQELYDAEIGLFFFTGHAIQFDGVNYLTAVDTDFDSETTAKYSSLPLDMVIESLEKGNNSTSIIILDACRNNPYEQKWRGVGSRGLAPVYAPKGTIIAFAASPGQVALDGNATNGRYTSALLKHIATQNITIEDLFKRVRNTVSASTSGKQISWEHTTLIGDFFFNPTILTAEFITEYSSAARADANFDVVDSRPVSEIIKELRSHDWYRQNAAIGMLSEVNLAEGTKDELFVLGRNLYQAACGDAHAVVKYLDDLVDNLRQCSKEVAFHILNGILYEIYFDSDDHFRKRRKMGKFENVFLLEDDEGFHLSFDFIQQSLFPYQKQLFYIPGQKQEVLVDVTLSIMNGQEVTVKGIYVDGQDVFYASDGTTLVSNMDIPFKHLETVKRFEQQLTDQMTIPKRRLQITYSPPLLLLEVSLIVPFDYQVRRICE